MNKDLFKKRKGKIGEEIAISYLKNKGYSIVERNFQKRYGEIDIIAIDGNTLVFVEVKARQSDRFGHPAESITPWKIHALKRSALYYKMLHPELPELMRLDLVAITLDGNKQAGKIELIKNIST